MIRWPGWERRSRRRRLITGGLLGRAETGQGFADGLAHLQVFMVHHGNEAAQAPGRDGCHHTFRGPSSKSMR